MTGPVWMPTWAAGRPAEGAPSTTSSPASTAILGSRKWNIPPSPSQRTGRPPRRRAMSVTRALLAVPCSTGSRKTHSAFPVAPASALDRRLGEAGPAGRLDGGQHGSDVVVGGGAHRGEPVDEPVDEYRPRGRVAGEGDQQLPDLVLELIREAAGGHYRLDGRRPKGADRPQPVGQPWVVAELDGQYLGVDRGRIHPCRMDHADGPLVKPASTTGPRKPGWAPMATRL